MTTMSFAPRPPARKKIKKGHLVSRRKAKNFWREAPGGKAQGQPAPAGPKAPVFLDGILEGATAGDSPHPPPMMPCMKPQ
jgi:hypothetical protein